MFAVFFIPVRDDFERHSPAVLSIFDTVKERLVTSFPKKVKLIIHPNLRMPRTGPHEELVDVSASFRGGGFLTSMLEIFTERWQTMDLISMMRELQRSLAEKDMEKRNFTRFLTESTLISTIEENLSCLIRFTMHKEPTN